MTDESRDPAASLGSVQPEQLDAIIEGLERIKELEAEIARLRLTEAERAFLELHAERLTSWQRASPESRAERVTVMGMLDRLG
jgi:predicted PP-loop superfamily ATPase